MLRGLGQLTVYGPRRLISHRVAILQGVWQEEGAFYHGSHPLPVGGGVLNDSAEGVGWTQRK